MANEIQIFTSEQFGQVRTVLIEGAPWFVAVDVCRALELPDTHKVVGRLDDDEKGRNSIPTPGGVQEMWIVNEPGLYSLVLGSRKPQAKVFKRWITHEVIPSIRKHGAYMTEPLLNQVLERPEIVLVLAQQLLEERNQKEAAEKKLRVAQSKVDYFDSFVDAGDCTNIRNTAKELNIPEKDLTFFLETKGYLYRDKERQLMPYAEYTKRGYFILRDYYRPSGSLHQYTLVTAKGKEHFRRILEKRKG